MYPKNLKKTTRPAPRDGFVVLEGVTMMQEIPRYKTTTNRVAPLELLEKLKVQQQEIRDRPLTFNEILRRSKGGFVRHRFGKKGK